MNILLIEDDVRVADFLVRGLQAEGYGTTWIRTGRQGLVAAEAFASACERDDMPGVVILDVLLPELDGLTLCQMLRKRNHQVPVLMLSAMGESHERADGLRRGADDYLAKPFDFDELLARVEALMRRARRSKAPKPLQIGTITVDRQLHGLRNEDDEVTLSALEMAMIELFVASSGATVSRERILARVWQADRDPLTNVVDVYVSRLRRKIGKLDPDVRITAVRGLGYRLIVNRA